MDDTIFIRIDSKQINYVNRIMEGYEYLGMVTTVDREKGLLMIRATADTRADVIDILLHLPITIELV